MLRGRPLPPRGLGAVGIELILVGKGEDLVLDDERSCARPPHDQVEVLLFPVHPAHARVAVTGKVAEYGVGEVGDLIEEPGEEVAVEQLPLAVHDAGERLAVQLVREERYRAPLAWLRVDGGVSGWGRRGVALRRGFRSRARRRCALRYAVEKPADRVRGTRPRGEVDDGLADGVQLGCGRSVEAPPSALPARLPVVDSVCPANDVPRDAECDSCPFTSGSCDFDEYEVDTPHNQALKSVIILLLRHGEVKEPRRDALRRVLPYLDEVTLISPRSIRWDALTYHRSNASYRLLIGVCELIVRGLLPTEDTGAARLSEWMSDDAMSRLYERFLRQYYAFHHPELSPGAPTIAWDLDSPSLFSGQLPAMQTDVTLRRGGRALIVDAKYYKQNLQESQYGKETIHSGNLYQMLAYVKNEDTEHDGSVAGLLLYARTDAGAQPDLDVVIQGNRIGAQTLDLNQPWASIAARLEEVLDWLHPVPEAVAS
ncbi:MAG: hypothetical protein CME34_17835 [Gordonia sp.]|nr:hypothetical protein [Gordonia sp. (in: high G+C Gram-positive bacteria)]